MSYRINLLVSVPVGEEEDLPAVLLEAGQQVRQPLVPAHIARQVSQGSARQLRRVPVDVDNRSTKVLNRGT